MNCGTNSPAMLSTGTVVPTAAVRRRASASGCGVAAILAVAAALACPASARAQGMGGFGRGAVGGISIDAEGIGRTSAAPFTELKDSIFIYQRLRGRTPLARVACGLHGFGEVGMLARV